MDYLYVTVREATDDDVPPAAIQSDSELYQTTATIPPRQSHKLLFIHLCNTNN